MLIFIIALPTISDASSIIHLKNGGRLLTSFYWEEKNEIKIYVMGGVIGIEKNSVRKIEKSNMASDDHSYKEVTGQSIPQVKPAPETAKTEMKEKEEKFDLKPYKSKKDQMTIELDELMEKKRKATSIGDNDAKEKLKEKIRDTSGKIYKLTDEVAEKNKGKLPEGWWTR